MKTTTVAPFYIIGRSVRTTNENGQSGKDIPLLWEAFFAEGSMDKIPGKMDQTLYCVYTDYEKDHTRPYTAILGCRVDNLDHIPEGFTGKRIEGGDYSQWTARGRMADGIVFGAWTKIWNATDLPRVYSADFEVYGEQARNPEAAVVDIFVAVK